MDIDKIRISMSYSGGTARGWQLAKEFDRRGLLHEFFIPSCGRKLDYFPPRLVPLLFGEQQIDPKKIRTSFQARFVRELMRRTARIRRAKPTERYWVCEAFDRSVARRLKRGSDIILAESHVALHTLRRAKELGIIAILDRTNSHVAYQSQIWQEENSKLGINWTPNDERDIRRGIDEYEEADFIFVLSSYVKRTFLERGVPEKKLFCVPSGIDLTHFHQIEKEDNTFRIIFCGILQAKKGVHYLLQAFDELKLKDAELWFIGNAGNDILPLLKHYKGIYTHWGTIDNRQLHRYYSQGSVFILPSLEEGLAKVIIEAMACGLPVIATTNTGAEDVVREGVDGFVIPIRNVEVLKEKILFLYENPDFRQQIGKNAKDRVHKEFTLDKYLQRIDVAFEQILACKANEFYK